MEPLDDSDAERSAKGDETLGPRIAVGLTSAEGKSQNVGRTRERIDWSYAGRGRFKSVGFRLLVLWDKPVKDFFGWLSTVQD